MNKLALLFFMLIFMFTNLVSRGIGADSGNNALTKEAREARARAFLEEEARAGALYHATKLFTRMTGKQPTRDNLVASLKIKNADGLKAAEVGTALDLLIIKKNIDKTLVPEIIKCYTNNSDWLVHVKCSEILLDIDEEKGVELAKKIIDDPQEDLEAKLSMSQRLVKKGKLFAYPVLRDGLITTSSFCKRMALELLEQYRPYDGKVWDEKDGEKINIDQLLKDVKEIAASNKTDVSVEQVGNVAATNLNLKTDDSKKRSQSQRTINRLNDK